MRKTIAQKKALEASVIKSQMEKNGQDWRPKGDNTKAHPILGLGACVPFAAVAYVCKLLAKCIHIRLRLVRILCNRIRCK